MRNSFIAACGYGRQSFAYRKNTVNDRTVTNVIPLDFEGRIREIARIMGGDNPSRTMLKSAEEELLRAKGV